MLKKLFSYLRLPRNVSSSFVFALFAGLVICNLLVLAAYIRYSNHEERLASSDEVITNLANTLYLLEISPVSEWPRITKISQTPELSVTLSHQPVWALQMQSENLGEISQALGKLPEDLAVSILLENQQWLNVKFTPLSDTELLQFFLITLGTVVAFALLFSAWSLMRFTVPLKKFKKAAEQLGVELRTEPMFEYGPAIVRETAFAMNQMQERITNLLQDRNRMLAAISHDLRTPITRLKLRAQFVEDKQQYQEIIDDLDEMEAMIDQILTYTKDASVSENKIDLDLVALLFSICDEKCEQGYQVECSAEEPRLAFTANALAIKRAFNNLVNNAVKYAKCVLVNITQQADKIIITIDDDGPGIPEDQLQQVFTPFYRVDAARSSNTGGSGLGLAIVQDVVRAHQGSIRLSNRAEGGLRVTVVFARN